MSKCPAFCIGNDTTFERVRMADVGVIAKEWYTVRYKRRACVRNRSTRYVHKERVGTRIQRGIRNAGRANARRVRGECVVRSARSIGVHRTVPRTRTTGSLLEQSRCELKTATIGSAHARHVAPLVITRGTARIATAIVCDTTLESCCHKYGQVQKHYD